MKTKTKMAPHELAQLSKPALADLVWALASRVAMLRDIQWALASRVAGIDHDAIVDTIIKTFEMHELASGAAYRNARGADAVPSDVLALRKLARTVRS